MSTMTLKSLVLENFKKHVLLEIDFCDTLTTIRGPNYRGKSSILESIFFCLFGITAIAGGKDNVTTTAPTGTGKMSAQLVFDFGNAHYYITRTLSTAGMYKQNDDDSWNLVATGHTAVNEKMIEMIGQDKDRVLLLAYSKQGETEALATLGESKLNAIVERISGATYADALIARCAERVSKATIVLDNLPDAGLHSPTELRELIADSSVRLEKELAVSVAADDAKEAAYNKLQVAVKAQNKAVANNAQIAENQKLSEGLKAKINTFKGTVSTLKTQQKAFLPVPSLDSLEKSKALLSEKLALMKEGSEKGRTLRRAREISVSWITEFQPKYEAAELALPQLSGMGTDLGNYEIQLADLRSAETTASDTCKRLTASKTSSICGACKRPFDDSHLPEIEKELVAATAAYKKAKESRDLLEAEMAPIKLKFEALRKTLPPEGWRDTLAEKQAKVAQFTAALADVTEYENDEMEAVQQDISDATASIRTAKQEKARQDEVVEELTRAEQQILANQEKLDGIPQLEVIDLSVHAAAVVACNDVLRAAEESLTQSKQAHKALVAETADLQKRLDVEVALSEKRAKHEKIKARFGALAKWLRDNKTVFLAETWEGMMAIVSAFASQCTNGYISKVGRSEEGGFWFEEEGTVRPIVSASGGQKSIIGTGLRLALGSLLPAGLGFLVLDEPSSALNNEHAAMLAGALRAQGQQIVLVTHREGEEFSSENLIVLD